MKTIYTKPLLFKINYRAVSEFADSCNIEHTALHRTLYIVQCTLCTVQYCILYYSPISFFNVEWPAKSKRKYTTVRRGALACTVPPMWLELHDKFLIGNLSYIPSSEPSRTGLLLDVMYTMYARHPP